MYTYFKMFKVNAYNGSNDDSVSSHVNRTLAGSLGGAEGFAAGASLALPLSLLGNGRLNRLAYAGIPKVEGKKLHELVGKIYEASGFEKKYPGADLDVSMNDANVTGVSRPVKKKVGKGVGGVGVGGVGGKEWEAGIMKLKGKTNPYTVAHEFGHISGGALGDAINRAAGYSISKKGLLTPLALSVGGRLLNNGEDNNISNAAPLVGGLELASILGEEGRANFQGAKILKNLGYKTTLGRRLRMFVPTTSYLGIPVAALLGVPLGVEAGIKVYNNLHNRGEELSPDKLPPYAGGFRTLNSIPEYPTTNELQRKWRDRI